MNLDAINEQIKLVYKKMKEHPYNEKFRDLYYRLHKEQLDIIMNSEIEIPKLGENVRLSPSQCK